MGNAWSASFQAQMDGYQLTPPEFSVSRELRDAVVEYVEPSASSYSSGPVAQPPCVHIFVLDSTIRPKDLDDAKRSVAQAIHTLPPDDMIGLITFDGVVRVFDMAREEAGFAQARPRASAHRAARPHTAPRARSPAHPIAISTHARCP